MADLLREAINSQTIVGLGQRIGKVYPQFDAAGFAEFINPKISELGLYERIDLVVCALEQFLPQEFEHAATILTNSLGEELDASTDDLVSGDLSSNQGFIVVALGLYIARHGIQHFEISMHALYEMTKRFSSEGPIRDFLIADEERTLKRYQEWVEDPNVHVRRLVSESTRPRLPWAKQLTRFINDPGPVLPLLEKLKNDPHLYVRRSVANHLNDISKDHPALVVDILSRWNEEQSPQMTWLTKHALRTLVKKGNPQALALLGFSPDFDVMVDAFTLQSKTISLGESLWIQLDLSTTVHQPQKLMIDYIIYHMKANGKRTPKVFKWSQKTITTNAPINLKKKHKFGRLTTRKYYSGKHEIHIQINGKIVAQDAFYLQVDDVDL